MRWLWRMKIKSLLCFFLITIISIIIILYVVLDQDSKKHFQSVRKSVRKSGQGDHHVPEYAVHEEEENLEWDVDSLSQLDDGLWHDFEVERLRNSVVNSVEDAEKENLPMIIWWTPFAGDMAGKIKRCWNGDCFFTQNRSFQYHDQTQAFLFYGTDFSEDDLPLPRKAHHEWGVLHEESPKNNALFYHEDTLTLFNHTSTFKQQSSYPISTQYINSPEYLLKPLIYTVEEKNRMKETEGLAAVIYVQSGCNPPSDRDSYVQELMKYIKIDSSGQCLHNKDLPSKLQNPMTMFSKDFFRYLAKYKFIISFENARCDDYMTEKIFRTLHVGSVPIYMGASNLREWLPDNNSVLMVDDYESPKHLAEYITFLDRNPKEYEKFLHYKTRGIVNQKLNKTLATRKWGVSNGRKLSHVTGFECHVCDQLHRNRKLIAAGKRPLQFIANSQHYGCPKPVSFPFPSIPETEDWMRDTWIWEYQEALSKAKRLREKVFGSQ